MLIKVRLFATLRQYVPEAKIGVTLEVVLPEGARVSDLIAHYHLPADLVKLAYVNGIYQEHDFQLHPLDEVGLFPPVGGG
ncbi:MAG TPA: MoaD/ThiS family protein [Anaerolineaceae bacterium]|nr:MoaD/ThiS family protein [Anaerolineaceae bacterium]